MLWLVSTAVMLDNDWACEAKQAGETRFESKKDLRPLGNRSIIDDGA